MLRVEVLYRSLALCPGEALVVLVTKVGDAMGGLSRETYRSNGYDYQQSKPNGYRHGYSLLLMIA